MRCVARCTPRSLVCEDDLTPNQQRRLEDTLEMRVVDRTRVILDIFALHARSAEGKLQVELAQLNYNLQRMRGLWKHLERLGGGVGTRGPGESQLETDRRLARDRVALLRRRLERVRAHRADAAKAARARVAAARRARRLHERRQVVAAERAHGIHGLGRRPPLPHARPHDARLRPPRTHLRRHGHGRLHPQAAARPGRGLRVHARGDARGRPHPARRATPRPRRTSSPRRSPPSSRC